VEIPSFREVNLEQEANIPTTQAPRQAETKISAEPFSDPLQNIDLSSYALLDGLPSKKSPPRVEESYVDQGNPWKSPTAPAPEPEFDVLKQRLANQTYPMRGARGEMRRDLVIVGLVTAILGAAVLAALLWLRPNVGFAMGRPQPEPAITTSSRAIAPAKVEILKSKQAARRTLPIITSAGLTPVATKRQFFPASVEEAAPPELPLDDSIRLQQLQAVMASTSSQPHLKDPSSAENFLEPENEINTPLEMTSPVYPESAKQAKLEGTVVLNIVVDKNGKVKRLDPISGDQQLADAAIKAVSKWRYRPSLVNGKRVESFKQVEMTFKLGERSADSSPQQSTQ
jgi:TonB family protein